MLYFNSRITIGNRVLEASAEFEVSSTWESVGDSATLSLPGLAARLSTVARPGTPILIEAGYDGQYFKEFEGFVSEVNVSAPFTLTLEDGAYNLKRRAVSNGWKKIMLHDLLRELGVVKIIDAPNILLKPFRLDRTTAYKALELLKENFGLAVYFRGSQLFAGLAYTELVGSPAVNYNLQANVVDTDLTFRRKQDVRLRVSAISVLPNNKRITVEVGEPGGDTTTAHFFNVESVSELRTMATQFLQKISYEGYRGSITTFGAPYIIHTRTARITDPAYPERAGSFYVDQVRTNASKSGGFRRNLTLGLRAA